jgi:actin-like ATPase involved in cell morphogenesis
MSASLVVDAGAELTTVWSPWFGTATHPSLVAVDDRGMVRAHGAAALVAKSSDDRLTLRRPFAAGDVVDRYLARSLLVRLFSTYGLKTRRSAIVFPLPPSAPEKVTSHWRQLAADIGGRALFASRPIANAIGLGLGVEGDRAHLLIEVTADFVEVGIISGESLIAERTIPKPAGWSPLVEMVGSMLRDADPDDELDIRAEGLHLVASPPATEELARMLADRLGTPVLVTGAGMHPVVLGARQIVRSAFKIC